MLQKMYLKLLNFISPCNILMALCNTKNDLNDLNTFLIHLSTNCHYSYNFLKLYFAIIVIIHIDSLIIFLHYLLL